MFNKAIGITIDPAGNIYVSEAGGNRVRKILPNGFVSTIAGSGTTGYLDGQGTTASFTQPRSIAISLSGDFFVADSSNNRIRIINTTGYVSTFSGTSSRTSNDGPLTSATFALPISIVVDSFLNIYVVDSFTCKLRRISPNGYVSTIAGSSCGFGDGFGTNARLHWGQVALDTLSSDIILADSGNNRIRRISICPNGYIYNSANKACVSYVTTN